MKIRVVLIATLLAVVMSAAPAVRASEGRAVSGRILQESPEPHVVHCAWVQGGNVTQGVLGWVVQLSPREGDGLHFWQLSTPGSVTGAGPLGVVFYENLGPCTGPGTVDDMRGATSGLIPYGARYAVIGKWQTGTYMGYSNPPTVVVVPGSLPATAFTFAITT